ncbi:hypothetical protein AgCh_007718 [Apium graveolens]
MVTNRRFISLASAFIVCLWVFSTYGNAASTSDERAFTLAASTNPADSNNLPGSGFPINIGGGGNSNGGGGWLRIWTPFGWITIGGGGGDNHGGDGGGGFQPFVPPTPPKPNPPHPPIPVTPSPSNPSPQQPSPPSPSNTPPHPSNPKIPPWLAPFIGSDGRLHEPPSPPPETPKWLAPFIGSDGRLHLPDQAPRMIPKWLAPYIGKPPQGSTPAHLAGKSMGTRSEASSSVETSLKKRHHKHNQCWLPLEKTDKCVNEILTAFSTRKFKVLGSACCSAIEKMDKYCRAKTIGSFHDHFFSSSVHRHCSSN